MARPIDPRRIKVIDDEWAAVLRAKSPDERLAMALECNEVGRKLLFAQIEEAHPGWTRDQVQAEVARRMIGEPSRRAEVRR